MAIKKKKDVNTVKKREVNRKVRKTQFKKGETGNPNGRRYAIGKDIARLRMAAKDEFIRIACEYMLHDSKRVNSDSVEKRLAKGEVISGSEMDIISVRRRCSAGDLEAINWFYNRIFGRPKESVDHQSSDGSMSPSQKPEVRIYIPKNNREAK